MSTMPLGMDPSFMNLAQQYDPTPFNNILDSLTQQQFTQGMGVGGSNPAAWNLAAPPQSGGLADIIFGAPGNGALSGQQSAAQPKQAGPLTDENLRTLAAMMPKPGQQWQFPGGAGLGRLPPQLALQQSVLPTVANPRQVPTLAQILGLR